MNAKTLEPFSKRKLLHAIIATPKGESMKHVKFRSGSGFNVAIGNNRSQAAQMILEPGKSEGGKDNRHRSADQWLYVISGRGVAIVEGKQVTLSRQTLLLIERGENHEIRNTGSTNLCTVNPYLPPAYSKHGDTLPAGRD